MKDNNKGKVEGLRIHCLRMHSVQSCTVRKAELKGEE
jgi:hypothetical protein